MMYLSIQVKSISIVQTSGDFNVLTLKYKFIVNFLGLIKLKTFAKLETTVCLLCLPEYHQSYFGDNCTVVGYGRPSKAALNQFSRGEIFLHM